MLILALGGVLVGFVFLVVSLVTENSAWAWGCIVACVAAAVVLGVDARRRRQDRSTAPAVTATAVPAEDGAPTADAAPTEVMALAGGGPPDPGDDRPTTVLTKASLPVAPAPVEPAAPEPETSAAEPEPADPVVTETFVPLAGTRRAAEPAPEPVTVDDTAEPDEEDADASDALVVAGLEQEVLVVDEHPRFHVAACSWLTGRNTMGLPAREAVELGFSPCSRCAPSRTLAALTRA